MPRRSSRRRYARLCVFSFLTHPWSPKSRGAPPPPPRGGGGGKSVYPKIWVQFTSPCSLDQ
jgi:hypothetical protein